MEYVVQDNSHGVLSRLSLDGISTVYLLGIGGIGMSALARHFRLLGYIVMGYDRTPSPLTKQLEEEGISVTYDDKHIPSLIPADTLVIRTPAVPEDEPIYVYLRTHGFCIMKRSQVLGELTKGKQALCVAGSHGKTTTTAMIAHIFHESHIGCNAFLGGIAENYKTNLLTDKHSDVMIAEADEYDRSFLYLHPSMSVITSIDPDHLDIYGTPENYQSGFEQYASLVSDVIVLKHGYSLNKGIQAKVFTYCGEWQDHSPHEPDFYARNARVAEGTIVYDLVATTVDGRRFVLKDIVLGLPVWVNIENSVAASAIALLNGITESELRAALLSFKGVYRRFNVHVRSSKVVYVDDYAHHPTELESSIDSIRRVWSDYHSIGIFQPHLYTRTRDFGQDFARVLTQLDEVYLLPIYPARELPIEGITSDWLKELCMHTKPQCKVSVVEKSDLVDTIVARLRQDTGKTVVLTLGAGDIDRLVEPLAKAVKQIL